MKALTAGEYGALLALDRRNADGWICTGTRSEDAANMLARRLVHFEPRPCSRCGRAHDVGLAITPLGRTAMRCYELATRPLDLGLPLT